MFANKSQGPREVLFQPLDPLRSAACFGKIISPISIRKERKRARTLSQHVQTQGFEGNERTEKGLILKDRLLRRGDQNSMLFGSRRRFLWVEGVEAHVATLLGENSADQLQRVVAVEL